VLLTLFFACIFILHFPLLNLPYYWDEAGYFVPAARDILYHFDFIAQSTLSNAHPPLVMAYLALCWGMFGESFVVTRAAMLLVAAFTLLGVFHLARRVANKDVAWATVICTALYPVFFAQSSLAHLDMMVAALTMWALNFYLPSPTQTDAHNDRAPNTFSLRSEIRRRAACITLLAIAALAKETAILVPLTLMGWELLCWLGNLWRRDAVSSYCFTPRRYQVGWALLLLLSLVPLALWFAYHRQRTGYVFGNPEYVRYNVASTLNLARILDAGLGRIWHVTGYMNLFLLTGAAALAMSVRCPLKDGEAERKRIAVPVQMVFAILILSHVVALSIVGGAVLARYMLTVLPLLMLICVSTLWRRVRHWRKVIAVVCAGFVFSWFINPPTRFPWEENLSYRHFITLHKEAADFLSSRYPNARVLSAWPATDELKMPFLGYAEKAFSVVPIEHFSTALLTAAMRNEQTPFDVALLFSGNYDGDLEPEAAAQLLNGRIVFREKRGGQWIAVIEINNQQAKSNARATLQKRKL
jgi:4-amino-4-deoxy-L-arabinose transferase-like glycosyltransferase